jgi:hypothetical protein
MAQNLVVALLVGGCFVYALWTLAPKVPRSRLATALLKLPMPLRLQKPLIAAARQQGGCACDGCDRSKSAKAKPAKNAAGHPTQAEFKPMTFVRGDFLKKLPRV